MIWIYVFAKGATSTLKQTSEVTVQGVTKPTTDGTVSFGLPAPGTYNVIVKSKGYQSFQGDLYFGKWANIQDVTLTPESPPPEGYTGYCTIASYQTVAGTTYKVVHPDLGDLKRGYTEYSKAQNKAHSDERCFKRFEPAPTEEEKITRNVIERVQGQIEKALSGFAEAVTAQITVVLEKIQKEADARIKALIDLEARIKAWITESIFELLMKNLNAAAIEYKKKRGT
jgi:hypothetical protein